MDEIINKNMIFGYSKISMVQWFSSIEMNTVFRVQIRDELVCITHNANNLGKDMNLTISSHVVNK